MILLNEKKYRHELKFVLSKEQAELLKRKLSYLMEVDENSKKEDYTYHIRSLYFDDPYDTAYYEKLDGLEKREKYRIRIYNLDGSFIRLERKEKNRDLTYKRQEKITKKQCLKFLEGKFDDIDWSEDTLLGEFLLKQKLHQLKPSVIVDYKRLAYTYPIEDTRITFDEEISSGRFHHNLFDKDLFLIPVLEPNEVVLEVKFNNALPSHLASIIMSIPTVRQAVSKFALCDEMKEV